MKTNHFSRR